MNIAQNYLTIFHSHWLDWNERCWFKALHGLGWVTWRSLPPGVSTHPIRSGRLGLWQVFQEMSAGRDQETCLLCYSPCHLEHSFLRNCNDQGRWSFVPRSGSLGTLRDPFLSILISMPIILLCIHIYLFYIGLNCFYAFTMHAAQSHLRWAATEIRPN